MEAIELRGSGTTSYQAGISRLQFQNPNPLTLLTVYVSFITASDTETCTVPRTTPCNWALAQTLCLKKSKDAYIPVLQILTNTVERAILFTINMFYLVFALLYLLHGALNTSCTIPRSKI